MGEALSVTKVSLTVASAVHRSQMSLPPSKPQDYHVEWIYAVQPEYLVACEFHKSPKISA